ncbi:MAG TPA: NAD-dependent epimerase/dehydratase family protein [Planctomycetes bacterium]|nr:NAD-dependent epimerase/dehydratase family protein [Fuerstiella sp.]HIK91040.1 NAD-dependent epimerase/dehydratase family protein [Planctomycetota bacterium]
MSDQNRNGNYYADRRVLITGGLGFIGSNLAHALVDAGSTVTLVDSMIPRYGASLKNIDGLKDRVSINYSDIRDQYSLSHLVREQDVIFSLAGQVSHLESMSDPMTDLDINCRSQLSLLECCRSVNPSARIVFASTRQIYGRPQFLPVTEEHPLDPADVNGINKLAAEMYYTLYSKVYGMHTVSLRLTNTYGPRMDINSQHKGFVGVFLRQALRGEPIELFGTGEQRRDFNHVADVVTALLLAGQHDELRGSSFNLGHDEHYSLIQFVEILRQLLPFEFQTVPFPDERQAIDIGHYYGDSSRFREMTGWAPAYDLPRGLSDTVQFFQQRPHTYSESLV